MVVPAGGRVFSRLQEPSGGCWWILSFLLYEYRGTLPLVKRRGRETNHAPPSAEIKNEWRFTSAPSIRLHGMDNDNFIFQFFFNALVCSTLLSSSCHLFRCRFAVYFAMNRTIRVCVVYFNILEFFMFQLLRVYIFLSAIPTVICVKFFFQ